MTRDLPAGTVTFVFTDIEGSTRLLDELGADAFAAALAGHRAVIRRAFGDRGGVEVDTEGDAFFYAFADASAAVAAAADAQTALSTGPIRVRMGIHTGHATITDEGYVGQAVHLAARIAAAGHGGQVLVSGVTRAALAASGDLTDLGEHRLKDFAAPTWLYQLGADRHPPLRTISNTNLPRPVSSFVGRDRETAEIAALLRDGARLLTLTGPGGTGKTRLAIEAATDLVPDFKNGVFWVALAALRDPTLVMETIGKTIGAHDGPAASIGDREMLLVVDNLEQVVAASTDLVGLLEACPRLRLLTTSRERLRVRGEVEYAVDPLPTDDGVTLFCARAQLPPDEIVVELCRRLDNLPLAIELAAARANALAPAQILARLSQRLDLLRAGRDADARQQTLRSTIEWSYELLEPAEQDAFARLAIFRGGFTIDTADAIDAADIDAVQSLADRSLIRRRDQRFTMLETVREYAAERLAALPDGDNLARRHAEHFLNLAEEAEPHLPGYEREWVARLDEEHDNIRAAFDFFDAHDDALSMQRFSGALMRFWFIRGHVAEGRRRVERALAASNKPTAARAGALLTLTAIAPGPGDELAPITEAMSIYQSLGDRRGQADAELALGDHLAYVGDFAQAAVHLQASMTGLRELGEDQRALFPARELAWVYDNLGQRDMNMQLNLDTLRRARELGNVRMEAILTGAIGAYLVGDGRLDEAQTYLVESQRLHDQLGDPFNSALNVIRFAYLLLARGKVTQAATLAACADALVAELGLSLRDWDPVFIDEVNSRLHAALDPAPLESAKQHGARMSAQAAVKLALDELPVIGS